MSIGSAGVFRTKSETGFSVGRRLYNNEKHVYFSCFIVCQKMIKLYWLSSRWWRSRCGFFFTVGVGWTETRRSSITCWFASVGSSLKRFRSCSCSCGSCGSCGRCCGRDGPARKNNRYSTKGDKMIIKNIINYLVTGASKISSSWGRTPVVAAVQLQLHSFD
jgi:hypothetical protein